MGSFDGYTPIGDFQPLSGAPIGGSDEGSSGVFGDAWRDVAIGGIDVLKAGAGVADWVASPFRRQGESTFTQAFDESPVGQYQQQLRDELSPERQAAEQEYEDYVNAGDSELNKFGRSVWGAVTSPRVALGRVMQSAPSMAAAAIPGAAVARGAAAAGKGAVAVANAAKWGAAAGEGLQSAGMTAGEIAEYNRTHGYDPTRNMGWAPLTTGASTALVSRLGGKFGGDIESALASRTVRDVRKGSLGRSMVGEGGEELLQAPGETIPQNIATDQPWNQGLGQNMGEGLVAGAGMGGAGHMAIKPMQLLGGANESTSVPAATPSTAEASATPAQVADAAGVVAPGNVDQYIDDNTQPLEGEGEGDGAVGGTAGSTEGTDTQEDAPQVNPLNEYRRVFGKGLLPGEKVNARTVKKFQEAVASIESPVAVDVVSAISNASYVTGAKYSAAKIVDRALNIASGTQSVEEAIARLKEAAEDAANPVEMDLYNAAAELLATPDQDLKMMRQKYQEELNARAAADAQKEREAKSQKAGKQKKQAKAAEEPEVLDSEPVDVDAALRARQDRKNGVVPEKQAEPAKTPSQKDEDVTDLTPVDEPEPTKTEEPQKKAINTPKTEAPLEKTIEPKKPEAPAKPAEPAANKGKVTPSKKTEVDINKPAPWVKPKKYDGGKTPVPEHGMGDYTTDQSQSKGGKKTSAGFIRVDPNSVTPHATRRPKPKTRVIAPEADTEKKEPKKAIKPELPATEEKTAAIEPNDARKAAVRISNKMGGRIPLGQLINDNAKDVPRAELLKELANLVALAGKTSGAVSAVSEIRDQVRLLPEKERGELNALLDKTLDDMQTKEAAPTQKAPKTHRPFADALSGFKAKKTADMSTASTRPENVSKKDENVDTKPAEKAEEPKPAAKGELVPAKPTPAPAPAKEPAQETPKVKPKFVPSGWAPNKGKPVKSVPITDEMRKEAMQKDLTGAPNWVVMARNFILLDLKRKATQEEWEKILFGLEQQNDSLVKYDWEKRWFGDLTSGSLQEKPTGARDEREKKKAERVEFTQKLAEEITAKWADMRKADPSLPEKPTSTDVKVYLSKASMPGGMYRIHIGDINRYAKDVYEGEGDPKAVSPFSAASEKPEEKRGTTLPAITNETAKTYQLAVRVPPEQMNRPAAVAEVNRQAIVSALEAKPREQQADALLEILDAIPKLPKVGTAATQYGAVMGAVLVLEDYVRNAAQKTGRVISRKTFDAALEKLGDAISSLTKEQRQELRDRVSSLHKVVVLNADTGRETYEPNAALKDAQSLARENQSRRNTTELMNGESVYESDEDAGTDETYDDDVRTEEWGDTQDDEGDTQDDGDDYGVADAYTDITRRDNASGGWNDFEGYGDSEESSTDEDGNSIGDVGADTESPKKLRGVFNSIVTKQESTDGKVIGGVVYWLRKNGLTDKLEPNEDELRAALEKMADGQKVEFEKELDKLARQLINHFTGGVTKRDANGKVLARSKDLRPKKKGEYSQALITALTEIGTIIEKEWGYKPLKGMAKDPVQFALRELAFNGVNIYDPDGNGTERNEPVVSPNGESNARTAEEDTPIYRSVFEGKKANQNAAGGGRTAGNAQANPANAGKPAGRTDGSRVSVRNEGNEPAGNAATGSSADGNGIASGAGTRNAAPEQGRGRQTVQGGQPDSGAGVPEKPSREASQRNGTESDRARRERLIAERRSVFADNPDFRVAKDSGGRPLRKDVGPDIPALFVSNNHATEAGKEIEKSAYGVLSSYPFGGEAVQGKMVNAGVLSAIATSAKDLVGVFSKNFGERAFAAIQLFKQYGIPLEGSIYLVDPSSVVGDRTIRSTLGSGSYSGGVSCFAGFNVIDVFVAKDYQHYTQTTPTALLVSARFTDRKYSESHKSPYREQIYAQYEARTIPHELWHALDTLSRGEFNKNLERELNASEDGKNFFAMMCGLARRLRGLRETGEPFSVPTELSQEEQDYLGGMATYLEAINSGEYSRSTTPKARMLREEMFAEYLSEYMTNETFRKAVKHFPAVERAIKKVLEDAIRSNRVATNDVVDAERNRWNEDRGRSGSSTGKRSISDVGSGALQSGSGSGNGKQSSADIMPPGLNDQEGPGSGDRQGAESRRGAADGRAEERQANYDAVPVQSSGYGRPVSRQLDLPESSPVGGRDGNTGRQEPPTGGQGRGRGVVPSGEGGRTGNQGRGRRAEAAAYTRITSRIPNRRTREVADTIINSFFKGGLGAMFTTDVVDLAMKMVPGLTKLREWKTLMERRLAEASRLKTEVADIKQSFDALAAPLQKQVNEFFRDMTLEEVWAFRDPTRFASEDDWQKYLGKLSKEDRAKYDRLSKQFRNMTAEQQKVIRDAVGHEQVNSKRKFELLKDLTKQQYADLLAKATSKAERDDLQKELNDNLRDLDRKYARLNKPYMPLRRFGSHVVVVKSPRYQQKKAMLDAVYARIMERTNGKPTYRELGPVRKLNAELDALSQNADDYFVVFADGYGKAKALAEELSAKYGGADVQFYAKKEFASSQVPAWQQLQQVIASAQEDLEISRLARGNNQHTAEALKAIHTAATRMYLERLTEENARKGELRRRKVAGFHENMMESFVETGRAESEMLADMMYGSQVRRVLHDLDKQVKSQRDVNTASDFRNEILMRHNQMLRGEDSPAVSKAMRTTSVWMLLTSPAYYLQNLTQPLMMSAPFMAGRHGTKAFSEVTKLMGEVTKWLTKDSKLSDLKHNVSADEFAALEWARGLGHIDIGMTQDFGRITKTDNKWVNAGIAATDKLVSASRYVEIVNRVATFLAAYRMEKAKLGNVKDAERLAAEYADRVVYETHGDYSSFNAPRYFKSNGFMKMATQFRKFQLIQMGFMARLLKDAFAGASREEKAFGRRALMWTMFTHGLMTGVKGMPIISTASALILPFIFGGEGDDDDDIIRKAIGDRKMADLVLNGVPKWFGVDLTNKLGAGQMLTLLPFYDMNMSEGKANFYEGLGNLMGPTATLGAKAFTGMQYWAQGDYQKAMEQFLPTGVANVSKALRFSTEGMTTKGGDILIPGEQYTLSDTLLQGIGVAPERTTDAQRLRGSLIRHQEVFDEMSSKITMDYKRARASGNSVAMRRAISEWQEMNRARMEQGFKMKPLSTLVKSATSQQKRNAKATAVGAGVPVTDETRMFIDRMKNL